jgi:hypothetical protein
VPPGILHTNFADFLFVLAVASAALATVGGECWSRSPLAFAAIVFLHAVTEGVIVALLHWQTL